jgi:hypothetical protein
MQSVDQGMPLMPGHRQDLPPIVDVVVEPLLTVHGYGHLPDAVTGQLRNSAQWERQIYWLSGPGAARFLQQVARTVSASPHMALQPFDLEFTSEMQTAIVARLATWAHESDAENTQIVLRYADEVAGTLLGNLVRKRRWQDNDRIGQRPRPLLPPGYTNGNTVRGGAFNHEPGRLTQEVASQEYQRFMLQNGLWK